MRPARAGQTLNTTAKASAVHNVDIASPSRNASRATRSSCDAPSCCSQSCCSFGDSLLRCESALCEPWLPHDCDQQRAYGREVAVGALAAFAALAFVALVVAAVAEQEVDRAVAAGVHPHERHPQGRLRGVPPSDGSLQIARTASRGGLCLHASISTGVETRTKATMSSRADMKLACTDRNNSH